MTTRNRGAEVLDTLAVLVASVALLAGFAPLFDGIGWAMDVLSVLVPTAAIIAAVRVRAPAWASSAGILAGFVLLAWVFAPGSTIYGLPTPASVSALGDHLGGARTVIIEEAAPITPPTSVVLLVAIAFVVTFVLGDAVARQSWRIPLLGLLWATMLVVPSVISAQMPPWWVFLGTAGAWLWLWWSESPHVGLIPSGAAALTGVGALAVALVLPVVSPRIEPTSSDFGATDSRVFGVGINPMIELGRSLRQSNPRRVLTYTTDADTGQYLKVATLRQFNGRTWSPSPVLGDLDIEGVEDLDEGIETEEVTTNVRIESLRSTYLPVPYPATEIKGLEGDWQWLRDGSTVRAEGQTSTEDQTYTVTSVDRQPTADQVRDVRTSGRTLDAYRTLPSRVPGIVSNLAFEHAGNKTSDYDKMLALQDWLRSEFTYSVEAPVEEDFDGNGLDAMREFLQRQEGYCVHFASTLAVMGRVLDVPTRVAVGYAPGDSLIRRTPETTTYGVDSDDLHAWTEAYFAGVGWISFDATPGIGEATEFAEPVDTGTGQGTDTDVPESTDQNSQSGLSPEDEAVATETETETRSSARPALLGVVILGVLSAIPAAVRQWRRRRRWNAGQDSSEPLWAEVADTARDLGIDLDPTETPRVFARRLGAFGADPAALADLVADVERSRYAGTVTVAPQVDQAQRVVGSLQSASSRRSRWLARIVPRSLLS